LCAYSEIGVHAVELNSSAILAKIIFEPPFPKNVMFDMSIKKKEYKREEMNNAFEYGSINS